MKFSVAGKIDPFWSDFTDWVKEKSIYFSQMDAKFDISGTPDRRIGQLRIILAGRSCAFRQYLSAIFAVFSLLFIALVGCNSGDGIPVQVGEDSSTSSSQDQITDLHYASPEEFWLSNPGCNENIIGVKAYVGEAYPYTCVLHGNEYMWTKVCEHNGLIYIEGESWFEGENCGRSWYLCKDGYTMQDPLGHPVCYHNLSSSSVAKSSSSSSKIWRFLNPKISYGEVRDSRDNQIYKTVVFGQSGLDGGKLEL